MAQNFIGGRMKRSFLLLILLSIVLCSLHSQIPPQHIWHLNVNFNIPEVYYIQINGSSLNFDVRFRGFTHTNMWQINNIPLTYIISANGSAKKLTAQLSESMPSGVELSMRITAPEGARSHPGFLELTNTPKDVLNDIRNVHNQHRTMEFQLRVNNEAPVMAVQRTLTFILRDQ